MIKQLTDKERKILNYQKRMGFVFAGLIISFGALFNLMYFVMNRTSPDYLLVSLINLGILILAFVACNRVNHKVNQDLKDNKKELVKKRVDKKIEEKYYEAGSGTLYIPFLGDLFPKLWGQKMKEKHRYFVFSNSNKYEVEKEVYTDLENGSDFYIHIAKHSDTVLSFSTD